MMTTNAGAAVPVPPTRRETDATPRLAPDLVARPEPSLPSFEFEFDGSDEFVLPSVPVPHACAVRAVERRDRGK